MQNTILLAQDEDGQIVSYRVVRHGTHANVQHAIEQLKQTNDINSTSFRLIDCMPDKLGHNIMGE